MEVKRKLKKKKKKNTVDIFPLIFKVGRLTSFNSQWKEVNAYNTP